MFVNMYAQLVDLFTRFTLQSGVDWMVLASIVCCLIFFIWPSKFQLQSFSFCLCFCFRNFVEFWRFQDFGASHFLILSDAGLSVWNPASFILCRIWSFLTVCFSFLPPQILLQSLIIYEYPSEGATFSTNVTFGFMDVFRFLYYRNNILRNSSSSSPKFS